jgi:hypothetical protein
VISWSVGGLRQGHAEGGQPALKENGPAILRPWLAVHFDAKLVAAGEGDPGKLHFEVFVSFKILDRNSQARFHKRVRSRSLQKSCVPDSVLGQLYINKLGI